MTFLPYLAAIEATGSDAREFLHAQLSNDVQGLAVGEALFACYCNPQGRVLDLLLIYAHGESFMLLAPVDRAADLIKRLRLFVMRSDVTLVLRDDLLVYGLPDGHDDNAIETRIQAPGPLVYGLGSGEASTDGDIEAWRAHEFETGVFWLNPAISGQFLPQMLSFDRSGAVNFRKGCYPGQEVIARTHYLGKVKRLPLLLWLEDLIEPEAMQVVQLFSGNAESGSPPSKGSEAVIVGHAKLKGGTLCASVVRQRDKLAPDTLVWNGNSSRVQRWATI
jgi:folate-binding protein YgfZ